MQRRGLPEGFHIWFTDEPFSVTQERRLKSPAEKRLKPVPGLLVCTSCGAGILLIIKDRQDAHPTKLSNLSFGAIQ